MVTPVQNYDSNHNEHNNSPKKATYWEVGTSIKISNMFSLIFADKIADSRRNCACFLRKFAF
jgi:hypothetical protein